jgi:predicted MPP superfamily phosphohydrolase
VRPGPPGRLGSLLTFLVAVLTVLASLHLYLAQRLVGASGLSSTGQLVGVLVFFALFLSLPAALLMGRFGPEWIAVPSRWVGYIWMGSLGVLLTATVGTDLVRGFVATLGHLPPDAGRLQALAIVGLALPGVAYALVRARGPAKVERVRVALPHLGSELQGVRLAQISDIHIGGILDGKFLARLVAQVNALQPDIVAVTGDLVDGSVQKLREQVRPLGELKAPLGVYFVTGNHEYYSGVEEWIAELACLGLTVLHNEHRVLTRGESRLVLGGVTDFNGGHFHPRHVSRPDLAFQGAPEGAPRVLLAHQPRSARDAAAAGAHLQLSGHTHGGQIFPFHFFVRLQQPTVSGLKKLHGIQVYTHRGSGFWGPPMRLGAPPEIAELTLVSG